MSDPVLVRIPGSGTLQPFCGCCAEKLKAAGKLIPDDRFGDLGVLRFAPGESFETLKKSFQCR